MVTVNIIYDTAIHLTDREYEQVHGRETNVQSVIEQPELYILARCPGDDHQLMYADCRTEDIRQLTDPHFNGIKIKDIVRFFHGDGPSCQMESGQQKNGRYACWVCPANFDIGNLSYMFCLPHVNIKYRMVKILMSGCSRERIQEGRIKLYNKLAKHTIIDELHQRDVRLSSLDTKKNSEDKLIAEMHGMQRLPLLLHSDQSMMKFLEDYEILECLLPFHVII